MESGTLYTGCVTREASIRRRKRSSETCSSIQSDTNDPSLNSTTFNSVCSIATASASNLAYASAAVVPAMNNLKIADAFFDSPSFKTDRTVWLIGNEIVMPAATKKYQSCIRLVATAPTILLLTTKNYVKITANSDSQVGNTGNG